VQVSTDTVVIDDSGTSNIRYDLDKAADDVVIEISSTDGSLVRVLREDGASTGRHDIVWDGLDANGVQMPKGSYTIKITAKDADDNVVPAQAYFTGTVDSVRYIEGQAYLSVDDVLIPLSEIMQVGVAENEG
jgi:flagellar basal-body rod modification protein FlgD